MIRDTSKLFLTHSGNLKPPSNRACGAIMIKKVSDSRNHQKINIIFEPKTGDLGLKFARGEFRSLIMKENVLNYCTQELL